MGQALLLDFSPTHGRQLAENSSAQRALTDKEAIRLACTTVFDPLDPAGFGTRTYHSLQAMRNQLPDMHFIGPLSRLRPVAPLVLAKREFYRRARKKFYSGGRDRLLVQDYSRQIMRRLAKLDANVVFSPLSPCSQPIAYLDCRQPIVIWTDTTWAAVVDFYPEFRSELICAETLRDAIDNERAALSRASIVIYWSDWAAQSAIRWHGLDPAKIRVIPPGPGFDDSAAISFEAAKQIVCARRHDRCQLLFVGLDWIRKGGDTTLEVAKRLNRNGLRTELLIVGCTPQTGEPLPGFVKVLGHISRATKDGAAKLDHLFKSSHFMFVPSRADAYGLVFAEANAFALPSITTDVGGIPTVVKSGVTGITFPVSTDPEEYCAFIEDMFNYRDRYAQLAFSALAEFDNRLNNRKAASAVIQTIRELL